MLAGVQNFYIDQGTTWSQRLQLKDAAGTGINITGWTWAGQIRKTYSTSDVQASFTITVTDAAVGKLTLSLTSTQTAALPVDPAANASRPLKELIYDLEATAPNPTGVLRILQGTIFLSPEVTRP